MVEKLKEIIDLFCMDTCMQINTTKSMLTFWGISNNEKQIIDELFSFNAAKLDVGLTRQNYSL